MQTLNITVLQTDIVWENIDANLARYESQLAQIEGCDLMVLPEMFSTGFSMRPEQLAVEAGNKSIAWMVSLSKQTGSAICGSTMMEVDGKYFNTLAFVTPDGVVQYYDKRHLFSPGDESNHYTAGKDKLIVEYKGWKICPLICYDLRFPVFSRNTEGYELLIYVANWPEKRNFAWQQLLKARAIENQTYVVACNRIGNDGNGVSHIGNSSIINYLGEELGFGNKAGVFSFVIQKEGLLQSREQFPVLSDMDDFKLL